MIFQVCLATNMYWRIFINVSFGVLFKTKHHQTYVISFINSEIGLLSNISLCPVLFVFYLGIAILCCPYLTMENCCKFILIIIIANICWVFNGPDPVSAVPITHPSLVVPKIFLYPQTYIKSTLIVRMRTLRLQEIELSKVKWAFGIWTWQPILVTNYLIKFTNLTQYKCKTCLLSHKVSQNK